MKGKKPTVIRLQKMVVSSLLMKWSTVPASIDPGVSDQDQMEGAAKEPVRGHQEVCSPARL